MNRKLGGPHNWPGSGGEAKAVTSPGIEVRTLTP